MSKAQLVITAVVLEGRSKSDVARDYDISRYWVQQLCRRYETEGAAAFEPRSRRPHTSPNAVTAETEERIVRLRKTLSRQGFDAGADTIAAHLANDPTIANVPAVSTIWRILARRGFVTPQPHKRPRSSWKRFCAEQPNQCWQADVTHWRLADHTEVEILNIIDDHSRLLVASHARRITTGPDVVDTFAAAFYRWGTPASVLTDNGAIFTAKQRGQGRTALEITLGALSVKIPDLAALPPPDLRQGRTISPNTQKTPQSSARRRPRWSSYNTNSTPSAPTTTPCGPTALSPDRTPIQAFQARPKAFPTGYHIPPHYRVRRDTIDTGGTITLRYNSRLHHIGLGRRLAGTHVIVLANDLDIRILHRNTGQLIRKLVLDPTRDYQPRGVPCGRSPKNRC